ncbi:MAG TPA: carboxylating nicotinate-nucleotide diphosphorylase [Clostridia bacterium]|nr:carboxylating nicotinate-nucleotide diphosphorylase [Clostridia bacterium]
MINGVTLKANVDKYILSALQEDITSEDVTTNAIMPYDMMGEVQLIAKQDGILCGIDVFKRCFTIVDENVKFDIKKIDGQTITKGELLGTITGNISVLLSSERIALNYLQRMSGIATFTNACVKQLEGYKTKLLDTRKTTPNMRFFEKYAVKIGGAYNHRYNLTDGVLIKDNHIGAAGSVAKAIAMAKEYAPFVRKIEVETENLDMVKQAVEAGADIIMLDNMDNATMKKAVEIIAGRAQTECSGNVTKERLKEIAEIGVDYVSSGALTYGAPLLDLSLKNLHAIN